MHKVIPNLTLRSNIYIYIYILVGLLTLFIINTTPTFADNVDYNVSVTNSLRLTIPSTSIDLNLDPATKPFDSKSFTLSVATNNPTGYQLMMSSDSTSLIKTNDNTKTIPTLPDLAGGYTESTFENNKWGYKIGAGNYIPFVSGATIAENDTTTNDQSTTLTFATKVNYLQAEGTYQTVLNFTVVANYVPVYMQYVEDNMCTTTPMLVVDNRDNQEYTIQRLADGNCWMMNNLNLGATDIVSSLNSRNTNITSTVSASDFNSWRKTSGSQSYTTAEYIPITAANSSNGLDTDETSGTKYGTLYNYCAATVGTFCYEESAESMGDTDATQDLCPAGWRLPKSGYFEYTAEFSNLYNNYDTYTKMRAPVSEGGAAFTLAGSFDDNSPATPHKQGEYGFYWSSAYAYSYDDNRNRKGLGVDNADVNQDSEGDRAHGASIRCVHIPIKTITFRTNNAESIEFDGTVYTDGQKTQVEVGNYALVGHYGYRQAFQSWNATAGTISNADYLDYNLNAYMVTDDAIVTLTGQTATTALQDITSSMCTSTPMPAYDNRDNQVYWIARLNDGRCWMMDSLKLGAVNLSTDLTSSNTNLADTISASTFNSWRKTSGTESYTNAEYVPITAENARGWLHEDYNDPTSAIRMLKTDIDSISGTKFGTLYNFCAVTAGTYCYDEGSGPESATYDICPKGWRLPIGNESSDSTNEFYNLLVSYNRNSNRGLINPIGDGGVAFAWGGMFYDDEPLHQSISAGYNIAYTGYWGNSRGLWITDPNFYTDPSRNLEKNVGYPVRCISTF